MSNFEEGNWVECIDASNQISLVEGDKYRVVSTYNNTLWVENNNHVRGYNENRFKLYSNEDLDEPVYGSPQYDNVNKPSHYQLLPGVEVKDVREAILAKVSSGVPYTQIDDWSRAWEYLTRMWGKNGLEDAKKAQVYLGWLITKMEQDSCKNT